MVVIKKSHYILVLLTLVLAVAITAWITSKKDNPVSIIEEKELILETDNTSEVKQKIIEPFIGVWIPYFSLTSDFSEEEFKQNFMKQLNAAAEIHASAVFVHIRPFGDSLYPSEYEPWSHLLTGTQGQDPGYDPLQFMIEQTHAYGMEFHAWLNPLRISTGKTPSELSTESFYVQNKDMYPHYFMEYEDAVYYNPAVNEIRERIANAAAEIVEKYDVNGIHFDDYFYPDDGVNLDANSYRTYAEHTEDPLSLHEWRKTNINVLIASVYRKVKKADTDVVFGISPQGNIANDIGIGADVYTWCAQNGYLDYICPQLYYPLEGGSLQFEDTLKEWRNLMKDSNAEMYVGLAAYKLGTKADSGAWEHYEEIVAEQMKLCSSYNTDGICFYAVDDLQEDSIRTAVKANTEAFLSELTETK